MNSRYPACAVAWALLASVGSTALASSPISAANDAAPPAEKISAANVRNAARLAQTGKVYSLAVVTGPDTPAYPGRHFSMSVAPVYVGDHSVIGANKITGHDDMVCTHLGIGTQIDGLGHIGKDGVYFGGETEADIWRPSGLKKFGIQSVRPIVARGVLIDMVALKGAPLSPDQQISAREIKAALKRQKVDLKSGDVVLIHTGWEAVAEKDAAQFMQTEPGLTIDAAEYLADEGAVAIGADNWGLEVVPAENPENVFPVHQYLLAEKGVYVLENIQTVELASDNAYEFLFILAPPRLEGAVQGIVHPVAIR